MSRSRFDVRAGSADALMAAFSLFLHDIRGSLGAASGSLRLAHSTDVPAPMIANAAQALGAVSRLTQHASTWIDALDERGATREWVTADTFVAAIASALDIDPPPQPPADPSLGVTVSSLDGVAAAIAAIVRHAAGAEAVAQAVAIDVTDATVFVRYGDADARAQLSRTPRDSTEDQATAFTQLAARQTVAAHGGSIWTLENHARAVAVAVPMERA